MCPNKCAYLEFLHNCKLPESSRFHKNARWIKPWCVFFSYAAFTIRSIITMRLFRASCAMHIVCNQIHGKKCFLLFTALFSLEYNARLLLMLYHYRPKWFWTSSNWRKKRRHADNNIDLKVYECVWGARAMLNVQCSRLPNFINE